MLHYLFLLQQSPELGQSMDPDVSALMLYPFNGVLQLGLKIRLTVNVRKQSLEKYEKGRTEL